MKMQTIRPQFTVFLYSVNVDSVSDIKRLLTTAGYETFLFTEEATLLDRLKQSPPHVIIFELMGIQDTLAAFVEAVLNINQEIQFIPIIDISMSVELLDFREFNFALPLTLGEHLADRCLWFLDKVCEGIYYFYQNEQLIKMKKENEASEKKISEEVKELKGEIAKLNLQSNNINVGQVFESYKKTNSKDDLVLQFFKNISVEHKIHSLYFKYLPTMYSFVATLGHEIDMEPLKGIGAKLDDEELGNVVSNLQDGKVPKELASLMSEGIGVQKFIMLPLLYLNMVDGIVISWTAEGEINRQQVENHFHLFGLVYQNVVLQKRAEAFDITDAVTELYNRNYYYKKVEEEIARARRLEQPLSLLTFRIDHFTELQQTLGTSNRDIILRTIANMIKKTSRTNDISCRVSDSEFGVLLPHCARKGAALRAERIRVMIESHVFGMNNLKVTISCGVSEYPSLSKNGEDLDKSSLSALNFIYEKGGNKVCLFKPTEDFKPDFIVPMV